jgi:predicted dehydrogenase
VHASAEALVEDPGIDVVHICTPNQMHRDLTERALAAGKHVICEKPLATDLDGAVAMAAAAKRSGLLAAVPFAYRFYPTVREARERVASGASGEVRLVHGTYLQDWLLDPAMSNWRVDSALGGTSRAFADIGSHWCDLAEFVSGHRITRLSARLLRVRADSTTEDAGVMSFETDRGAIGSAVISQISGGRKNRLWLEIDAAHEALAFDQENPDTLWRGTSDGVVLQPRDPLRMSAPAARLAFIPAGHPQGYQDCFDLFVADAYAAVRSGEPPDGLPTFADGARAAQLVDAVLRSAPDGAWVEADER